MHVTRSRLRSFATVVAVLPFLQACGAAPETHALDGTPLFPPELSDELRMSRTAALELAIEQREANPEDPLNWIWEGRRRAYLGQYRDAVETFTEALDRFPDEPRLYRHRGHRFVTLRDFDRAIDDLEHAATLIEGTEDRVEPDGLPNARGIPTSTLHTNVYYHLGLAHFLRGDYDRAADAYQRCLAASKNADMLCATTQWLYVTLWRAGREGEAKTLLEPITADMDVIENHAYHRLLLAAKGEVELEDLVAEVQQPDGAADGVQNATLAYGVANLLMQQRRTEEAKTLLQRIVAGDTWAAFGYIAAEVDLAR